MPSYLSELKIIKKEVNVDKCRAILSEKDKKVIEEAATVKKGKGFCKCDL